MLCASQSQLAKCDLDRRLHVPLRVLALILLLCSVASCCKQDEIPSMTRKLYSSSARDRNEAALALAKCDSPAVDAAVPRLIDLMYDENVGVQSSAAYALRKIDTPDARRALERATERKRRRS
jgi:HEAT repeat protein